jgi:hypothetical protein
MIANQPGNVDPAIPKAALPQAELRIHCNIIDEESGALRGLALLVSASLLYFLVFNRLGWVGGPLALGLVGAAWLEVWCSCRLSIDTEEVRLRWTLRRRSLRYGKLHLVQSRSSITLVPVGGPVVLVSPPWWQVRKRRFLDDLVGRLKSSGVVVSAEPGLALPELRDEL